jgi:hypothetical protein
MTVKIKVKDLMEATVLLSGIIREQRAMPQSGKFRLARLHQILLAEFNIANGQRDELIKAYNYHPQVPDITKPRDEATGDFPMMDSSEFSVPDDKLAEFEAAWSPLGESELEVQTQPIPIGNFILRDRQGNELDGALHANELIVLKDFITE